MDHSDETYIKLSTFRRIESLKNIGNYRDVIKIIVILKLTRLSSDQRTSIFVVQNISKLNALQTLEGS